MRTVTATHGRERLVAQIMSAEEPVVTVRTITNVAQAKSVVISTVRHFALLTFQTMLFGPEVLLPQL